MSLLKGGRTEEDREKIKTGGMLSFILLSRTFLTLRTGCNYHLEGGNGFSILLPLQLF